MSDKCNAILTEDLRNIQNEFMKLIETMNLKRIRLLHNRIDTVIEEKITPLSECENAKQ